MKKSTYDAISMIAVVSLVVFTVASQHSNRGYVFGVLAILTAVGLFVAYIKASPKSDQKAEAVEVSQSKAESKSVGIEIPFELVPDEMYRVLRRDRIEREALIYEAVYKAHRSHLQLLIDAEHGARFRRDPDDPASIIANIVDRLCASSKEPRFEFILEPDGRFKIQQISAKRAAGVEPIVPQEPVEAPAEPEAPQLIN